MVEVIGLIVLSFLGVEYGFFYYCSFERDKLNVLWENKGNFGFFMIFFFSFRVELNWWIFNVDSLSKFIFYGEFEFYI